MAQKVALVTGANRGIGLGVVKELAKRGFLTFLGSRDLAKGQAAAATLAEWSQNVIPIELDVTSDESVTKAFEVIKTKSDKIDVLVNNAGIMDPSRSAPPTTVPLSTIQEIYDVNVFGALRVYFAALPLLRATNEGRVINLSSALGSLTLCSDAEGPFEEVNLVAYNSSKSALNAVTISLAKEQGPYGIKINAVCPGWCNTDMGGPRAIRTVEQGTTIIIKLATDPFDTVPQGRFLEENGELPW